MEEVKKRFLSHIIQNGDCWGWTGAKDRDGYGLFRYNGRTLTASRMAWILFKGRIPAGKLVLHNCPCGDNPSCVNPNHLWIGTQDDNMKDAKDKGRLRKGDSHPTRQAGYKHGMKKIGVAASGEKHGSKNPSWHRGSEQGKPVLTDHQRKVEVPHLYQSGMTQREIGEKYGVSQGAISAILKRVSHTAALLGQENG